MRVLLATYDSRGGVEPLLGLAVRLRELGAEVRMCAPPDCAERPAEVGVPLVPFGPPVHRLVHGVAPPPPADVPRRVAEVTAVAGTIRTDGATLAATRLVDQFSPERMP